MTRAIRPQTFHNVSFRECIPMTAVGRDNFHEDLARGSAFNATIRSISSTSKRPRAVLQKRHTG